VWEEAEWIDSTESGQIRGQGAGDLGWAGGRYPGRFYLHAVPLNPMSLAKNPILGRAISTLILGRVSWK
jgi:hypothetical protein